MPKAQVRHYKIPPCCSTQVRIDLTHNNESHQMLSLPADLLAVLRMVTRASLVPTRRASSLLCLSKLWPAKAVEAHAVAAAMSPIAERSSTFAVVELKMVRQCTEL